MGTSVKLSAASLVVAGVLGRCTPAPVASSTAPLADASPRSDAPLADASPRDAAAAAGDGGGASLAECSSPPRSAETVRATFFGATRIFEITILAAAARAPVGQERCVGLDVAVIENFRGGGAEKPTDRLHLMVTQSLVTAWTARPGGAWWVGEQTLEAGRAYVAFCADGPASTTLPASCKVYDAAALREDLRAARDLEARGASIADVVARTRKQCASTSYLLPEYLWTKHGAAAQRDVRSYDLIVSLLEEPSCASVVRNTLLDTLASSSTQATPSLPHIQRLAKGLFRVLAMPEAKALHENVVDPYLMVVLGLQGGAGTYPASVLFAGDPAARARAQKTLATYVGSAKTTRLVAWLDTK